MASTIQVRVDDELKSKSDQLFKDLGTDTTSAIRMFLTQAVANNGFPFEIKRVELYNPSSDSVSLGDYSIGLTRDASSAWQLPHHMVAAGGRTMVWCDKESKQKQTDFRQRQSFL